MQLNEQERMSLEAGEVLHTIANRLCSGEVQIDEVTPKRAELIMELSEALRKIYAIDRNAPLLAAEGFRISEYPRSVWIDLAGRLIDAPIETPIENIIKYLPTKQTEANPTTEDVSKNHRNFRRPNSFYKWTTYALLLVIIILAFQISG